MERTIYFKDVDNGFIVRKRESEFALEYLFPNAEKWELTEPDSPYEREYYLGEGNTCLFDITEGEAYNIVESWGLGDLFYVVPEREEK